ncbi:serine hydrolase domain-containing protein [Pseudogracilibacillus sp. SO30301A]|uniref:serine hydrolase domain-containing protein n=1 Tax=Pseudogracilibacillus sp. SO30301A TaxID=3098291 RepID=UPI00300E4193
MYDKYLAELVNDNQIPGGVLTVSKNGELVFLKSYGSYENNKNKQISITDGTIFDLASLTKVMVTLPSILYLYQMNELDLQDSVQTYLPQLRYPEITIKHLLQHTSGLPADLPNMERSAKKDILSEINQIKMINKPGIEVLYSDLGMILLGEIIEKITGMRLNAFVEQMIYIPWKLQNTKFLPKNENIDRIAATEFYKDRFIHGEVHDEKAFLLGGISGSAGLFSTANDVMKFANYWLYPETQSVIVPELMYLVNKNIVKNRGLAFQVKGDSNANLSCGRLWPIGSIGHTGFTGTSLWIDPHNKLSVVFLTNVVHVGRKHSLPLIREKLHTLIFKEEVMNKSNMA